MTETIEPRKADDPDWVVGRVTKDGLECTRIDLDKFWDASFEHTLAWMNGDG